MPAPSGLAVSAITDTTARLGWTPVAPEKWRLTVTTTGASQDYTVDINAGTTPNIDIDWGDGGAVENFTTTGQKNHTFTSAGTYTVKISGSFASGGNIRLGSNSDNRARLKGTGAIPLISGLVSFQSTFSDCTALTSIPTDLFRYNTAVSTSGFYSTFQGCTGITAIPTDLFRYNTAVSTSGFRATFQGCTGITAIPTDLFRYNLLVSVYGFYSTFNDCTGITAIPTDLFRYNTAVSTYGFTSTFQGCTGITAIPTDLFRYNTAVSTYGFTWTFQGCTALTSIPTDLFRYNVNVSTYGFQAIFRSCIKLQLVSDLFGPSSELGTRFLDRISNFQDAFKITSFTGTKGTAPALWNYDYGNVIELDVSPTTDWAADDVITGQSSGATCVVVSKVNATSYRIKQYFGTFTLGEVIGVTGNADKLADQGATRPTFLETLILNVAPATAWAVGDVITGQTSGATCTVVSKYSVDNLTYTVKLRSATYTLGEIIGVTGTPAKLADQGAANPIFNRVPLSTTCFNGHSVNSVDNYADIPAIWR